ncbi:MAG: nucleotide exchange factor GrpE [Bacteroidales bacterium]|nr:nucleotide exchange factor GrpE [Bacteroidales bacterium]
MKEQKENIENIENNEENVVMPEENQQNLSEETNNNVSEEEASAEETDNAKTTKKTFFGKRDKSQKKIEELEAELEKIQAEKAEFQDKFVRLYSEFDNYRKRVNKEKLDLLSTASEKVIVSLLPIIDDFERAINANEKAEDLTSVKEGFNLIYTKLIQLLKKYDVEEIVSQGEPFNTDFHEAVTHFPTDKEEDKGKVIDVTEKGYKMKDKVIRFAKVVVAQ